MTFDRLGSSDWAQGWLSRRRSPAVGALPFHGDDARRSAAASLPARGRRRRKSKPPRHPGLMLPPAECADGMVAIGIFELHHGARCDYVLLQRQIERGSFPFNDQSTVTFADQCRENGPC